MSTTVTVSGLSYSIPATGDSGWSDNLSQFLIAVATSTKVLQNTTTNFPIVNDLQFGTTYGLLAAYYKSVATSPSGTGQVRLGNAESVSWRNAANNADLALSVNGSNALTFGGTTIPTSGSIVNADINAAAAIAYSKLNLTGGIVNADINAAAAIAYSKLSLTGAVQNTDLAGSIALTKLASVTAASVVLGNASNIATATAITGDISITNAGVTAYSGTVPVAKGGTGATAAVSAPVASAWAGWDANKNLSSNNLIEGYATTATAAGTTVLTVASAFQQYFTGTTTQTVTLPVASTLTLGQQFLIANLSSGVVTVQSSGANNVQSLAASAVALVTCVLTSGTTAASWSVQYGPLVASALTNPMTTGGDLIYGGGAGAATRLANGSSGQVLQSAGGTAAPAWATLPGNSTALKAPTVQRFTSASGTYALPSGPSPLYIKVRMVGGGGGGGGAGSSTLGGTGGNTTFGTSLLVANGGTGGQTSTQGGTGGTASLGTGPVGTALQGASGSGGGYGGAAANLSGGAGGSSPFGGAGGASYYGQTAPAGVTNSGSGGGGRGINATNSFSGGGGAAGGYVEAIIVSPSSTYSYSVGAAGAAGADGGSGAGGAGGSGVIIVEEFYQ